MIISILLPFPLILELTSFYRIIQNYYYFVYVSQFIGMLISSLLYISLMLKPIREAGKKQKMKVLKQEKKDLKKEKGDIKKSYEKSYDELKQSQKDLLKEKNGKRS